MARQHTPLQQFREAKQIASDHGLLVVEKAGRFLLYRNSPERQVYLGFRTTAAGLRRFVCNAANFH